MADSPLLLEGIKVLDVASFIAAPAAATVLADFGAEVIKVEPLGGDPYRYLSRAPGQPKSEDFLYHWFMDNRHKRSIALDLKSEQGREVMNRLVAETDVFVTNFPLDVRERLGLRYEDIGPKNDRLIYASMTAYGETGAEATRPGFDSTAWWARSGMMDLCKPDPQGAPARSLPGMGDHATAMSLFAAIMTALYRRERTGKGGHVASSLMVNGLWSNGFYAQAALAGIEVPRRPRHEEAANAMANHYRCRDGRWFILALLNEEKQWPVLAKAIDRPDLVDDPRFRDTPGRHSNAQDLVKVFIEEFGKRDWPEWRRILKENRLAFGDVELMEDILHDQQMQDGGALVSVDDPSLPCKLTIDSPFTVDGEAKRPIRASADVGQHTEEILRGIGFDDQQIFAMHQAGVIEG